ncbi:MAG: DNA gyrase subunit A [Candidatus Poseidoniia archaeon]|nr:DNA gyrase subunit A [Candidatus Poseidoniia archaeon]
MTEETTDTILKVSIVKEMRKSYLDYAMSVIVGRALPDARDGLKPVHRRVLYAMKEMGSGSRSAYKKSARIVGDTMGKYHPHGDQSIYDTMVRMAQGFSLRYPLVDGQGNFGSVDGDKAAAMRYTESRLALIADSVLSDIDEGTVDFRENYDGSLQEPTVLPGLLPGLLVNGSSGIAVGMATNMAPHNLSEIIAALNLLIDNPRVSLAEIMTVLPGPDFPTGGTIMGRKGIFDAYTEGQGSVKLRGKITNESDGNNEYLIVTEIPFMVQKNRLLEDISKMIRDKKIEGIRDLRDESDQKGMRVVFELKRDASPIIVENQLYKHSVLETSFSINNVALVNGKPQRMNLIQLLKVYLAHRKEIVTRRTKYRLGKAEERAHIVEGLLIAISKMDKVIAFIRGAAGRDEVLSGLQKKFSLSKIQSKAIAEMRLYQLSRQDVDERKEELSDLKKTMAELKSILADRAKVMAIIKEELQQLDEKHGDARRTVISDFDGDLNTEDLIPRSQVVVMRTYEGYIKRVGLDEYQAQHRGGKGRIGIKAKEGDFPVELYSMGSHDHLLFFTTAGSMYFLKAWQIPDVSRYSKGTPLVQLLQKLDAGRKEKDEKVLCMLPVANIGGDDGHYFLFATKKGIIKKTRLEEYSSRIKRAWASDQGFRAITLKDKDELIGVAISEGDSQVMLATKGGMANRFSEGEVRIVGRNGQGVIGMRLKDKDEVIGMSLVGNEDILLTITEKGYGKRASADNYRLTRRGAKGVLNIKVDEKSGYVVATMTPGDANQILATTSSGKVIRTYVDTIRQIARIGRGVKVMAVDDDETVVAVALHNEDDEEKNADPPSNGEVCPACNSGKLVLDDGKYVCGTCGLIKDA